MLIAPAPWWETVFLERPLGAVIALAWIAAILAVLASRRANKPLGWSAGLIAALAIAIYLLARFVETDREALIERTRQLVEATAPLDLQKLDRCFDPRARLIGPANEIWLEHDAMIAALESVAKRNVLHRQSIRRIAAETTGDDQGRSELHLTTSVGEQGEFPIPSSWLLTWKRDDAGHWRLTSAQWLTLRGEAPRFGAWR